MRKPKLSKADVTVIVLALVGALLQVIEVPHARGVGIYLFIAAFIGTTYRIWKKAKSEKKEVFFP